MDLVNQLGKSWAIISELFPQRTCNQVKNQYNSCIRRLSKKKVQQVPTAAASFNDSEVKDTHQNEETPQESQQDQTDKPPSQSHKLTKSE